jgi:hypothetical protein
MFDPEKQRAMESSEKFMEIKETIEKGEAPKNVQMEHFLSQGQEILEETKEKIRETEAKKVVEQTQEVLGSMKEFLDTRNQDEVLQRIGLKAAELLREATTQINKADRKKAKDLVEHARNLLRTLVISGTLRRNLLSIISIMVDLTSDFAKSEVEGLKEEEKEPSKEGKEPGKEAKGLLKEEKEPRKPSTEKATEKEEKELRKPSKEKATEKEKGLQKPSEKVEQQLGKAQESLESTLETQPKKIEELQERIITVLNELARNQGLRDFRQHFLSIVDYFRHNIRAFDTTFIEKSPLERHLLEVIADIREFLGRFTPLENLDKIGRSSKMLLEDESFGQIWNEWRDHIDRSLEDPNWAKENKNKLSDVLNRIRDLMKEKKISDSFNTLINSFQKAINDIQNDPVRLKMEQDLRALFSQLMLDDYGRLTLDKPSLSQLQSVIIPTLVGQLKYIAIPKFYSRSDTQEFSMRNIFLSVPDLVPDKIHFDVRSEGTLETKHMGVEQAHGHFLIDFSDIQIHIKHAQVHFKRFTFPKLEDNLLVNTDVYGPNTSIRMVIAFTRVTEEGHTYLRFFPADVQTKLDHLNIKVLEGKHEMLMNFLTTVLNPLLKARVEKNVSDRIRENLEELAENMTEASRNMRAQKIQQTMASLTSEMKQEAH